MIEFYRIADQEFAKVRLLGGSMLRIITLNANGIRSAHRKGLFEWLSTQKADILCLQETRAHAGDLQDAITVIQGYRAYFCDAEKKGYCGVAMYLRRPPDKVTHGLGWADFDREGRFLQADYGPLSVISVYVPSGSSSAERQQAKFDFLARFMEVLRAMRRKKRDYIVCGDWNIAHKPIDLKNWRSNQKNSGFLPEERAWLDAVFTELGFVDAFRRFNPAPEQYTWWSNRGQAWAKNVGWRIDYQIVTPGLAPLVKRAQIYKEQRFSDHAPLLMDYKITI